MRIVIFSSNAFVGVAVVAAQSSLLSGEVESENSQIRFKFLFRCKFERSFPDEAIFFDQPHSFLFQIESHTEVHAFCFSSMLLKERRVHTVTVD